MSSLFLMRDVLIKTLTLLDYRNIRAFCCTSLAHYSIQDTVIKHKQKLTKGFPRPSGKHKYHKIPENNICLNESNNYDKPLKDAMNQFMDNIENYRIEFDLTKGDIVEFSPRYLYQPHQAIFNGDNLEEMGYFTGGDAYLTGDEFQIIHNDVPIDYWYNENKDYGININFQFENVRDQCLANIKWESDKWITTFSYNNYNYCILWIRDKEKDNFIERLSGHIDDIMLFYDDKLCKNPYTLYMD